MQLALVTTTNRLNAFNLATCLATGGDRSHAIAKFTLSAGELEFAKRNTLLCPESLGSVLDEAAKAVAGATLLADECDWTEIDASDEPQRTQGGAEGGEYEGDRVFYFESILGKDERTGKNGVRGPYPWCRFLAWQAVDAKHRVYDEIALPEYPQDAVLRSLLRWAWAVRRIRYAPMQLGLNLGDCTLRLGIPGWFISRMAWTCSEGFVRCLDAAWACSVLGLGDIVFDAYAPSGKRAPGLKEKIRAMKR